MSHMFFANEKDDQMSTTSCPAIRNVQILSLDVALACPPEMRLAKQYLFDLFRAYTMFRFDLVNELVFPDDLM